MRMKRSVYEIEQDKHRKLRNKLIDDDMSFNEFMDRVITMYLDDKYQVDNS